MILKYLALVFAWWFFLISERLLIRHFQSFLNLYLTLDIFSFIRTSSGSFYQQQLKHTRLEIYLFPWKCKRKTTFQRGRERYCRCATTWCVTAAHESHLQAPVFSACLENNPGTACPQRDQRAPCCWPRPLQPIKSSMGRGGEGPPPWAVQSQASDSTVFSCPSTCTCIPACTPPLRGAGERAKTTWEASSDCTEEREAASCIYCLFFGVFCQHFRGLTSLLLSWDEFEVS